MRPDKYTYPTFVRTVSSFASQSQALVELVHHLGWTRLSNLLTTVNLFVNSASLLTELLDSRNVTAFPTKRFSEGSFNDTRFGDAVLQEVEGSGVRVTLVLAYEDDLVRQILS